MEAPHIFWRILSGTGGTSAICRIYTREFAGGHFSFLVSTVIGRGNVFATTVPFRGTLVPVLMHREAFALLSRFSRSEPSGASMETAAASAERSRATRPREFFHASV